MDKEKLAHRYRSLWMGEATSSALFTFLFLYFAIRHGDWLHWILRGYALAVVLFILLQGISWWRWKQWTLAHATRIMPSHIVDRFRRLRTLNWLLISGYPLALLIKVWIGGGPAFSGDFWFGLLILGGAILEQVNYYYFQLMYDSSYDWNYLRTHRRLRRGTIAKVLARQDG